MLGILNIGQDFLTCVDIDYHFIKFVNKFQNWHSPNSTPIQLELLGLESYSAQCFPPSQPLSPETQNWSVDGQQKLLTKVWTKCLNTSCQQKL